MADILIRGMEMPADNGCYLLTVRYNEFGEMCAYPLEKMGGFDKRDTKFDTPLYPIVALPEGHGDLIDRNALPWEEQELNYFGDWSLKAELIDNAPTIVPADKDGAK